MRSPRPPRKRPGPVRVLDEREARDPHRVVQLGLLDRRVLGVLAVRLHRVGAVAREAAAVAAAERLEEAVVLAGLRVDAAEAGVAHHRLRPRRQPLGQGGEEGAEDHVDEPRLRLPAADDRARPGAVRDRSLRRVDRDEAVEAVVDGQIGVDQALDGVRAGGERLRVGRVDRGAPLRVGAGQVEADAVGGDLDPRLQPHRLVGVAVGVDRALGLVDAVRQRRDLGARAPLGVVEQLAHRRRRSSRGRVARRAPAAAGRRCCSRRSGRGSRRPVSCLERICARIRPEDVVGDDPARLDDLHRRDDHALLEHLAERADRSPARRRRRRRGARGSRRSRAARRRGRPARSG